MNSVFVSFYNSSYKTDNNSTKEELQITYTNRKTAEIFGKLHSGKGDIRSNGFDAQWKIARPRWVPCRVV